ncbi:MAG: YfiR family protein [Acidobacteriota bacterium]
MSLLLWCAPAWTQNVGATRQVSEEEVKAAFLLNFVKFVEWPDSVREAKATPFSICIVGSDPFREALDGLLQGETVAGRPVIVERVRRWQSSCQVVFVGASELDVPQALGGVQPGVLTVGEETRFLREGGMIALVVDNHRVRFDVNLRAANKASVRISSRLLAVARAVER